MSLEELAAENDILHSRIKKITDTANSLTPYNMNNLSSEQIARVFATYLGRECKTTFPKMESGRVVGVDYYPNEDFAMLNIQFVDEGKTVTMPTNGLDDVWLLLRPLSAISDEDAIEVARLCNWIEDDFRGDDIAAQMAKEGRVCLKSCFKHFPSACNVFVYQLLIQQGYAVPLFIATDHPDNGKTAIELGFALDSTLLPDTSDMY